MCSFRDCSKLPPHPTAAGKNIDPITGIFPICQWGNDCGRGWVRDERFGSGQVIKGTNRDKTRKVYRSGKGEA